MAGAKSHYLEMFHIFLNTIRPDHPRHIYESMRNIMTSVIEEYDGDEISAELLKPLLASVRRDNMNVSPVAWELGTAVIQKCAIKLKPLLQEAVRSMNLVVGDYADIVISLCRDTSSGEIMDDRKTSEALQFDEGVQNDGSLSVTLRSNSEQIKLSDTDEVTSHNMEHVAAFVIDTSLRSFQRKKRTKTNLTRELAGPSDSSRQEFLSGACSSKGLHFKQKNKSLNDQAGESSSQRKPTKAMSGKKLSQEMGKKPETNAAVEYGDELVNKRIMVFWPAEKAFFTGTITAFDPVNKKHTVTYDYGDVKVLNLKEEKWEPFKYSMFVDRRPQKFVQSSKEEKTNHPPPAKESLKSREKAESRKVGLSINEDAGSPMKRLKRDDHDVLHFRGDSVSAQNVVLVADMPISQRSEENNAGHENQTEPSRRISSRSTKGYHYKQRSREKAESRKVGLSINEDAGSSLKRLKRDDHDILYFRGNSEQIKLSDTDEVTPHNMEHVAAFVKDTSLRSFQRKKRTKTNVTRELAGPSDSSRQEFLSGACSSKGLHFKQKNKSLNDQAGESSSRRKPTKAMSGKKLSQEMGKIKT